MEDLTVKNVDVLRKALKNFSNRGDVEEKVDRSAHHLSEESFVNISTHSFCFDGDENLDSKIDESANEGVLSHGVGLLSVIILLVFKAATSPICSINLFCKGPVMLEAHDQSNHNEWENSSSFVEHFLVCVFCHTEVFF